MKLRIETDADIDKGQWNGFVCGHPKGNIFQTPLMYAAYSATRNYRPIALACYEGDSLVGILLAVVQKEYKGIMGKFSARSIIWCGPLIKNDDMFVFELIMKEYNRIIRKQAIYTQIRNNFNADWAKNELRKLGYTFEDHLNILVDLKQSEDELWKNIHGKRRNEIRRAVREGTTIFSSIDDKNLESAYEILKEVYYFARLPFPDISLFRNILSNSIENSGLRIFVAKNQGKMIGVLMALVYKNRIYDWFAGAYRKHHDKYPNDLLPWEVFRWGQSHGYEIFDFGGAGKPGVIYGVRDYKMKFGGELVNYGRFEMVHQPLKFQIAKVGFKAWKMAKTLK